MKYSEAIYNAQKQVLLSNPDVVILGLGVPGPTGIFGTTKDLQSQFGNKRVIDTPSSENTMTGVALGAATAGKRVIMVHMRVDFALLAIEPLINQAAKWSYMYGGKLKAPIVIRLIIGRGWGQGPQHSQALHSWFAHVPGLKVIAPSTPSDCGGMLITAVEDDAPVLIFEHRWLYNIEEELPKIIEKRPLEGANVVVEGKDVTLVALSYMVVECIRASKVLKTLGVSAEVIDMRNVSNIDFDTISTSVKKTKRLIVCEIGHVRCSVASEVLSQIFRLQTNVLLNPPSIIGLPETPTPTTPALAKHYYPDSISIVKEVVKQLNIKEALKLIPKENTESWKDTPDNFYVGPY